MKEVKVPNVDVFVKIKYDVKAKEKKIFIEDTNIKEERLEDFLLDWLLTQVGAGKDKRERIDRDLYEVIISCDLSDDTFYINSNTGNKGLTAGIVIGMVGEMGKWKKSDVDIVEEQELEKKKIMKE